jgi:hypothetical protein
VSAEGRIGLLGGQISALRRQQASEVDELGRLIADLPFERVPFAHARDWAAFTCTGC